MVRQGGSYIVKDGQRVPAGRVRGETGVDPGTEPPPAPAPTGTKESKPSAAADAPRPKAAAKRDEE